MTKVNKLGWRNFVSGVLAVLVGLIPVYIYCLFAAPVSAYTASTIGFLSAIGLGFGIIIGTPLELFIVPRFRRAATVKTIAAYLLAGFLVDLAVNLYYVVPAAIRQPSTYNPVFYTLVFLMIFIVYTVVAVIARIAYAFIHRAVWRQVGFSDPFLPESFLRTPAEVAAAKAAVEKKSKDD
jgi:hypothetical protein